MIAPQLATMIAVIITDCAITPGAAAAALARGRGHQLQQPHRRRRHEHQRRRLRARQRLRAGTRRIDRATARSYAHFTAALAVALRGAGARDRRRRRGRHQAARGRASPARPTRPSPATWREPIAGSSLVKAAIFGADPNWGRVLATVGARAGSPGLPVDPVHGAASPSRACTVYDGGPAGARPRAASSARMREPEVQRRGASCAAGEHAATAWGCDLCYDYVKINADYTSLHRRRRPDGGVGKDDRLANYSPAFKVTLLVEALELHRALHGQALRRQVRRRGDGEGVAQALLLRATSCCCARWACVPDRGPRRRAGDHPRAGEAGRASPSSSTACASPTPRTSRSWRWS